MAVTPIPVFFAPFQGGPTGSANASLVNVSSSAAASGGVAIAATGNMEFVNSGYTVLFVSSKGTTGVTCTVVAQPDNAGRAVNVVKTCSAKNTTAIGPFRPIWWNYGGVVAVGITGGAGGVSKAVVSAVQFQF